MQSFIFYFCYVQVYLPGESNFSIENCEKEFEIATFGGIT